MDLDSLTLHDVYSSLALVQSFFTICENAHKKKRSYLLRLILSFDVENELNLSDLQRGNFTLA